MAVYKKKDKTAKQIRKERAHLEDGSTTQEVFDSLDTTAGKLESWILKHQSKILTIMGIVVLVIVGYMLYLKYVQEPKELEASDELSYPKSYFEKAMKSSVAKDSLFQMALNGAEGHEGLLDIADRYSSTKAGNLANYYIGMAYLRLNDYKKAVEYLDKFETEDEILSAEANGAIGDAFTQLGDGYLDQALEYYEKALNMSDNSLTRPMYLKKAGIAAMNLKKYDKAKKYFSELKENYNTSIYAQDIDVLLNMVQYK